MKMKKLIATTLATVVLFGHIAGAEDFLWEGSADSNFFNEANWDLGAVPSTAEDLVVFDEGMNFPVVIPEDTGDFTLGGFQLGTSGAVGGSVIQNGGTLTLAGTDLASAPTFFEFKSHIGDKGTIDSSWEMNNDATIYYDAPFVPAGTGLDTDGINGFDLEIGAQLGAADAVGRLTMNDQSRLFISDDLKIGSEDNGKGEVFLTGTAAANIGSGISLSSGTLSLTGSSFVGTGNSSGPGMNDGRTNEGYLTLSTDAAAVANLVVADDARLYARTLQQRNGQTIVDVSGNGQFHIFELFTANEPDLGNATVTGSPQGPQRTSNVGQGGEFTMTLSDNASFSVDSALEASWVGFVMSGGTNRGDNSGGGTSLVSVSDQASFAIAQDLHMTLGTDESAASTLAISGPSASVDILGNFAMSIGLDGFDVPGTSTIKSVITDSTHTSIDVGGSADIEFGQLAIELDGYTPVGGEEYTILNAGEVLGEFSDFDVSLAELNDGLSWNLVYSDTDVKLLVEGGSAPVCGDFDGDGDVDSADRTNQTTGWTGALDDGSGTATFANGDCDGDGDVDSADVTGLVTNWTGAINVELANSVGSVSSNVVPEPSSLVLVSMAAIAFVSRRRRLNCERP